MSTNTGRERGRDPGRENPSAAPSGGLLPDRGATGGRGQARGRLTARGAAAAEANAQSSATSANNLADLIDRVANNTTTPAERESFDQKLGEDLAFHLEVVEWEQRYRDREEDAKADRLRAPMARMLLARRSRPPFQQERNHPAPGGRSEQASQATKSSLPLHDDIGLVMERVIGGTASKAQKKLFTYALLANEEMFEQIMGLQKYFESRRPKADQDKAKRLAKVLKGCNKMLLEMHEDAVPDQSSLAGETFGSSPSRGSAAGGSAAGSSAAGSSVQFGRSPPRKGGPATRDPAASRTALRADTPSQSRAGSQIPEGESEKALPSWPSMRAAAPAAQQLPVRLTNTLEQMRLEEQQQGPQGSEGSGVSIARTRAPNKVGKSRSKK